MKIGNRLFPYPLLNKDKSHSSYKTADFSFNYSREIENDHLILKNFNIELSSIFIRNLINNNRVSLYCVIEFPAAFYRKSFKVNLEISKVKISLEDICGKGTISLYIVANENIENFNSGEFDDDYLNIDLSIEKYDIIAVDDGYIEVIDFDEEQDNLKSSIFVITKNLDEKSKNVHVDYDIEKIEINLPSNQRNIYNATKKQKALENLYFSILAIPALSYCLGELKKHAEDMPFDSLLINYKWFEIFINKYNELFQENQIDNNNFNNINCYLCAQQVLNNAVNKSLIDIRNILANGIGGQSDDD